MSFKVDSVVQLKSGGPKLTVAGVADGKAVCSWAVGEAIREKSFDLDMLQGKAVEEYTDTELADSIGKSIVEWLGNEPREDASQEVLRKLEAALKSCLERVQARAR